MEKCHGSLLWKLGWEVFVGSLGINQFLVLLPVMHTQCKESIYVTRKIFLQD